MLEKAVIEAKKKLQDDEVLEVLKQCSYGGCPITMEMKRGGDLVGKAYGGAVSENK